MASCSRWREEVRQFYGTPSQHLWEDDDGFVHIIHQGEGGEQGDPLMPMLFALGQHQALRSVQHFLRSDERLFAYFDDIHVVCAPERVGFIRTDQGGFVGVCSCPGCTHLQAAAQVVDPNARKKTVLHSVLLDRIPVVQDLQSAWLLLLYCANTWANYWLRGVPPEDVAQFASEHDVATQTCLSRLLGASLTQDAQDLASLTAFVPWRLWASKRLQVEGSRILGQLGGQPPDDPSETP